MIACTQRTGDHATTYLPPGTTGSRGDPAYDENVETARDDNGAYWPSIANTPS